MGLADWEHWEFWSCVRVCECVSWAGRGRKGESEKDWVKKEIDIGGEGKKERRTVFVGVCVSVRARG